MILFFRKIRQKLLSENRVSKYFLYAIGEILLVMIGILLALEVNNWNEISKTKDLEQKYLNSLKAEFSSNLTILERVMKMNNDNIKNAIELSDHTGPGIPKITDKELSILTIATVNNEVQYRPGSGVINEIISSGRLGIFQNEELKSALASWDGILLKVRYQEQEHGGTRENLFKILEESSDMRKMTFDAYGKLFGIKQSKFKSNNLDLLQSKKFDNLLIEFVATAGYMGKNYYGQLEQEINKILDILKNELDEG